MDSLNTSRLSTRTFIEGGLYGTLCAVIWGGWILITSSGVKFSLPVADLVAIRFFVVGALMLPVLFKTGVYIGRNSFLGICLMTMGAGSLYFFVAAHGMKGVSACHIGGLLPGTMPLFSAILSVIFLQEKMSPRRIFGLGLIITGAVVLGGLDAFQVSYDVWLNYAELMFAALLWSIYTVSLKYWQAPPLQALAIVSVFSAVTYLPLYLLFYEPQMLQTPLNEILLQGFYQGVLTAIVAFFAYSRAITLLGAARGSVFVSLVPVLATLMGIPFLGEQPTSSDWAAIVLLSLGVYFATGAQFLSQAAEPKHRSA